METLNDSAQSDISDRFGGNNADEEEEEDDVEEKVDPDHPISASVPSETVDEDRENEIPYVPPNEEILKRLVAQAEFYFSDENILKDTFLLKHIRKDKEGYVSLKLLASFRRLQRISKNWRDLAYAVPLLSDKLDINEKKTKVKRKNALPDWDKTSYDRTVVAINFQSVFTDVNVENVKQHFSKCGEIGLVRILNPGKKVPHDLQSFVRHHPELASHVCVLLEFRTSEGARNALKEFSGKDDWRGLQVLPLKKKKIPAITTTTASSGDESSPRDIPGRRIAKNKGPRPDFGGESSGSEARSATSSPKFDRRVIKKVVAGSSAPRPIPVPSRVRRNDGTPGASPELRRWNAAEDSPLSSSPASLSTSPWVRRRVQHESESNSPQTVKNMIAISRQPHGPDGTKGFSRVKPL
jgi:hypothetical protein